MLTDQLKALQAAKEPVAKMVMKIDVAHKASSLPRGRGSSGRSAIAATHPGIHPYLPHIGGVVATTGTPFGKQILPTASWKSAAPRRISISSRR
jgi:hypothetical protein